MGRIIFTLSFAAMGIVLCTVDVFVDSWQFWAALVCLTGAGVGMSMDR
jgi:hypothetical protein